MSWCLNQVELIWNISSEIITVVLPNGTKTTNFSLATNRDWKDANGNKQEEVEFHNIVAFWNLAERIEKFCSKGKKLFVKWRLKTRNWVSQDWVKKYKTEIVIEDVIFLSPNNNASSKD